LASKPKKGSQHAQNSKLEIYLDFLKLFADSGPLSAAHAFRLNSKGLTQKEFRSYVAFLEKQALISRGDAPRKTVYTITHQGIRVLSYFKLLPNMPQLEDIENKTYNARPLKQP
jgi:predicted transcriptional regulator